MTTAKQINKDYKNNLIAMMAECSVWGKIGEVRSFIGKKEYCYYFFNDESFIEFEMEKDEITKAKSYNKVA